MPGGIVLQDADEEDEGDELDEEGENKVGGIVSEYLSECPPTGPVLLVSFECACALRARYAALLLRVLMRIGSFARHPR